MARKSKYTPERATIIIESVRVGMTYRLAAAGAGITDDTLTAWKARYQDFSERLMAAEAEAAQNALKKISEAARDDWRAAAWILEHRHPDEFGRQVVRQELSGPGGAPLQFAGVLVPLPEREDEGE